MEKFITNGFKWISVPDNDVGFLIDNCLAFLYAIEPEHDLRRDLTQIEAALYDMVYVGQTAAGYAFKENLFRTRILPLMKRLAPTGYYFGIDPQNNGLLGYWRPCDADAGYRKTGEAATRIDDSKTLLADSSNTS